MRRAAFEIEAVALFEAVRLAAIERDLDATLQDVQELLAFVRVGLATSR